MEPAQTVRRQAFQRLRVLLSDHNFVLSCHAGTIPGSDKLNEVDMNRYSSDTSPPRGAAKFTLAWADYGQTARRDGGDKA